MVPWQVLILGLTCAAGAVVFLHLVGVEKERCERQVRARTLVRQRRQKVEPGPGRSEDSPG